MENTEDQALLFAKSLFSYAFSNHPLFEEFSHLVRNRTNSAYFTDEIGKAVLHVWLAYSGSMKERFRRDFPKFIKDKRSFEKYLKELLTDSVESRFNYSSMKVIVFSGILLELIAFLYRRRITEYVYSSPYHWLYMFEYCSRAEFLRTGGWKALAEAAKCVLKSSNKYYVETRLALFWISEFKIENSSKELKTCRIEGSTTENKDRLDDAYQTLSPTEPIQSLSDSTPSVNRPSVIQKAGKGIVVERRIISPKVQTKSVSLEPKVQLSPEKINIASKSEPAVASTSRTDVSSEELANPFDLRNIPNRPPRSPAKLRLKMQNKMKKDEDTPLDLSKKSN